MAYRKQLYIPITRSGKSIGASILTQCLDQARRQRREDALRRMQRNEISPLMAALIAYPFRCWLVFNFLLFFLLAIGKALSML